MSKMTATILMVCDLLAIPVLGDWVRDGPYADVSDPFYYEAPDWSWGCGWDGSGCVVEGDACYLNAHGATWGEAWVYLLSGNDGLDRGACAGSHIHGWTNYTRFRGDDPLTVQVTIGISAQLDFSGWANDEEQTCTTSCSSWCWALDQGMLIGPTGTVWADGGGIGLGTANTVSGTYAQTYAENVTPYDDWVNYGQATGVGTYVGRLYFYGTIAFDPWSTPPQVDRVTVDCEVSGLSAAEGHFANNNNGGAAIADAPYYVSGSCRADVSGYVQ